MLEAYTQLSTAQEQALHEKIKASIVASSTTASGEAEKSGRIKRDISPQDSKSAKKQLNLAYDFMIKLAKAKVPSSVSISWLPYSVSWCQIIPVCAQWKTRLFFVHHEQVKSLLQNLIAFINNPPPSMALTTVKAIAQSIFLSIHPFHDGNGRTNMLVDVYAAILHDRFHTFWLSKSSKVDFCYLLNSVQKVLKMAQISLALMKPTLQE